MENEDCEGNDVCEWHAEHLLYTRWDILIFSNIGYKLVDHTSDCYDARILAKQEIREQSRNHNACDREEEG